MVGEHGAWCVRCGAGEGIKCSGEVNAHVEQCVLSLVGIGVELAYKVRPKVCGAGHEVATLRGVSVGGQ